MTKLDDLFKPGEKEVEQRQRLVIGKQRKELKEKRDHYSLERNCSRSVGAFLHKRFMKLSSGSRVNGGPAGFAVVLQAGDVGAEERRKPGEKEVGQRRVSER